MQVDQHDTGSVPEDPPPGHPFLKGQPDQPPEPHGKARGWHPVEWACEMAGTAFQLFLGFSAVALFESSRSPLSGDLPSWARLVVIGICFGLLATVVAVSPVGRRSGAHLNPAVTLGFVWRGHTSARDASGFIAGQFAGALLAAAVFGGVEGGWATSVHTARTAPADGLPGWAVVSIEAALTATLLLVIFTALSSPRTARWTPLVVTGALAGLIWVGAPHTGASMNPARTLGPDIVSDFFPTLWAYFVGPVIGSALAVIIFGFAGRERRTLTAKLFHDPDYPSVHATVLPARPHPRARIDSL